MNRKEFEQKVRERNTDGVLTKRELVGYYEKRENLKREMLEHEKEGRMNIVLKSNRVLDEFLEYYLENYENISGYYRGVFTKKDAEKEWTVKDINFRDLRMLELIVYRQDGYNHIEKSITLPPEVFYDRNYYYTEEGKTALNRLQIIGD